MRATIHPLRNFHMRPSFWGVERDFKEVIDSIETMWEGSHLNTSHTNFKETDQAFLLSLDMPGVNKKNLDIQIEGEQLFIKANRKNAWSEDYSEPQEITKTVFIPKQVDKDKIQAHCEDGVLYFAMPKVEKAKPTKIQITEGGKNTTWSNLLSESKKETKNSKKEKA